MSLHAGEAGEILGIQRTDGERRRIAGNKRLIFGGFDMNGGVRQVLHNLGEQLARDYRPPLLLDKRCHRVLDRELQVGRLQNDLVTCRLDEDARQDRQS